MAFPRLALFLAIGAVILAAAAASPGDYKSCEACVDARTTSSYFTTGNYNAWCDKGGASACLHEDECTGYTAITVRSECLPTTCTECVNSSDGSTRLWCDRGLQSVCTKRSECGTGLEVDDDSKCPPATCTKCLEDPTEPRTWCEQGMKSVCTLTGSCDAGYTKKTFSFQCLPTDCDTCVTTKIRKKTLTWCMKGSEQVCISTGTCESEFEAVTNRNNCLPDTCGDCLNFWFYESTKVWCADESLCARGACGVGTEVLKKDKEAGCIRSCDACLENSGRTWCDSLSELGSVCKAAGSNAAETCGEGFVARTEPAECVTDCNTCLSDPANTWCDGTASGSSSVCKATNGVATCGGHNSGLIARTEYAECTPECSFCMSSPGFSWCEKTELDATSGIALNTTSTAVDSTPQLRKLWYDFDSDPEFNGDSDKKSYNNSGVGSVESDVDSGDGSVESDVDADDGSVESDVDTDDGSELVDADVDSPDLSNSSPMCREENHCPSTFTAKGVPDCVTDCASCMVNPNFSWCEKSGSDSMCTNKDCPQGFSAKTNPDCIEDCHTCIANENFTWCHGGSGSSCKATNGNSTCASGFTALTHLVGCIEDCPTCAANADYTWCRSNSGSGSMCKAKGNNAQTACGEGFTARTEAAECIEHCHTCIASFENTWCHSGSGSVCKAAHNITGEPTCAEGFTSKSDMIDCIEDCATCVATLDYTWCQSNSGAASKCKSRNFRGNPNCGAGFTPKTEASEC